jgi:hypothetical protein
VDSGTGGFDSHALPPRARAVRARAVKALRELELREARPGDEERALAAFNKSFAAADAGFRPRTLKAWRWRYRDAPDGARAMLAMAPDGAVVAQYAGLGQVLVRGTERLRASQSVDSFVDPAWRASLGRMTAFARTGVAYAERFGGDSAERDVLMWGLPVPAAWRIGRAKLGYEFARSLLALVRDPQRTVEPEDAGVELEEVQRFPREVDALFERVAPTLGLVALRDARRLDWRYADHPEHTYSIALARMGGELAGYAVYRRGSFDQQSAGLVCDWLVDRAAPRAASALRNWLRERARADGERRLVALLPDCAPEWIDFQRAGWRVEPTRYTLAARSWRRALPVEDLRSSFWVALGDTDLV